MASSMLTGDRRWGQTRKSGMTVLGKVPKPINLPSQRLENHGLDPTVEIVPKGTLTWGSRPSSGGTNAWGTSSTSSPHADGSAGSPSFASGRPSSGESGTRPSTAGSDRSREPVSSAWGSNSRPSSASGILASSQMSAAATRPRSADTRPGSSQLSRFAESSVDNSVARGATGTADGLGAISSKICGFTLSSGDFPTLGSEKNSDSHSQRGHSSQGRPASSSGTASRPPKEALDPHIAGNKDIVRSDHGNVNTWKVENHPYVGNGTSPYTDNWQHNPQQARPYANVNMPPRQFDSWHNLPLHPADGPWYRGGAPVGSYRPPGPPGSYFDYSHVSARPLANSEAGLAGYRPNSSEQYRPHMPQEPYMGPGRSNIPLRPGPYPGPMPFEGYYRPQTGFYSSGEVVRPVIYNQYPTQNPNLDPGKYHPRPGGYATSMYEEQVKFDQAHMSQGQFRVLLKQHDGCEGREADGKCEQSLMGTAPHLERGNQPGLLRQEGDWRTKKQNPTTAETLGDDHPSDAWTKNSSENSMKAADDGLIRREETTNPRDYNRKQYPITRKDFPTMEKGDGLNTKSRVTDGHDELGMHSSKQNTKSSDVTITADRSTCAVDVPTSSEAILVSSKQSDDKLLHASVVPRTGENAFQGQKSSHDVKGDQHTISKSSRHGKDELAKKVLGSKSSLTTCVSGEDGQGASALDCAPFEVTENHVVPRAASSGDESFSASSLDTIDIKAQRAKMKEMALQRAKQLQKEEEERTREQKAKALAKLEELNRRTLAETSDIPKKQLDSGAVAVPTACTFSKAESPTADDDVIRKAGVSINVSSDVAARPSDSAIRTTGLSQTQVSSDVAARPSDSAIRTTGLSETQVKVVHGTASDTHDASSKNKQSSYRRRQTTAQVRSTCVKEASATSTESPEQTGEVAINTLAGDALANDNKNNLEPQRTDPSMSVAGTESPKSLNMSVAPSEALSVQSSSEVPMQGSTETTEESHARFGNHSKPQPHKKPARKQHASRSASKHHGGTEATVVWAPVKPPSKNEPSAEVAKNNAIDATGPSGKSGHDTQSAVKTKRAEIERYVPKPVAQQNSPVQTQAGKPDSGASNAEDKLNAPMDGQAIVSSDVGNVVNVKHNKQGKKSASWHQRGPAESPSVGVQEASDQLEPSTVGSVPKGDPTCIDEGWNDITDTTVAMKDVAAHKQRRQPSKAQRVLGSINHPTNNRGQPLTVVPNDSGEKIMKTESENVVGEQTKPRWQPKPQAYNHRGSQGRVSAQSTEYNVRNERKNDVSPRTVTTETRSDRKFAESAPADVSLQQHGHRGRYDDRFQRGRDSGYGGDSRNFHKKSTHLEYQQVGQACRSNPVTQGAVREGPRSHHRPRGGGAHFYGRSSGSARVSDSYNNGE